MAEYTISEALRKAHRLSGFLVVRDLGRAELIRFISEFKDKNGLVNEVFYIDGADLRNYPSFESIKLGVRYVIKGDSIYSNTEGLIFPQDTPIILVIDNFDQLREEDRIMYLGQICKREEIDYHPKNYLHERSVVILNVPERFGLLDVSYKLSVTYIN